MLAAALVAAKLVNVDATATTWAAVLLRELGYLMIWPIVLGVAATRLRERDAYLTVMGFSLATELASSLGGVLVSWIP
jgi:hypothetical protein